VRSDILILETAVATEFDSRLPDAEIALVRIQQAVRRAIRRRDFRPFFSTKAEGTSMGLTIVRSNVKTLHFIALASALSALLDLNISAQQTTPSVVSVSSRPRRSQRRKGWFGFPAASSRWEAG